VDWNKEFQELYSKVVERHSDEVYGLRRTLLTTARTTKKDLERAIQLRKLAAQFASFAEQVGVIIIKELSLPENQKTLKPQKMGGVAGTCCTEKLYQVYSGGEKYIACGIFFKVARDWVGLYGGDSFACKAAEHELKGNS
jgi:hypothetical protein